MPPRAEAARSASRASRRGLDTTSRDTRSCSRVVTLLADYLDNRLAADERTRLEEHLGGCGECAAYVGTFRSTVSLLQSLTDEDLPEELRLRLRAFLNERCKN